MYELSKDFLTTYDPNYLEQHSDSSDFEDTCSPVSTPRYDCHRLRKMVHNSRSKEEKNFLNQQIFDRYMYNRVCCHSTRELWNTKPFVSRDTTEENYQPRKRYQIVKTADRADQIDYCQLRTVMRHKLIPCISSMFRRSSNNVKQMSIIKENRTQNLETDNGNHCDDCGRKIRKLNRRQQCYAAQPVYEVRGGIYGARETKVTQSPLTNVKHYKDGYYNEYDLPDSEHEIEQSKKKRNKRKNKQVWKAPFQMFTTPYQCHTTDAGCTTRHAEGPGDNHGSTMASSSSGFWEYIMDKFNRISQTDKDDILQQGCNNGTTTHSRGAPNHRGYNIQQESLYRQKQSSQESCNCSHTGLKPPNQPVKPVNHERHTTTTNTPKVQCKCANKKEKPAPSPKQSSESSSCSQCQKYRQPHDKTAQVVAEKYKGEILCIHNPPCILINGCLNLPPPRKGQQFNVCPYADNKISYHGQTSQYPPPCYDVHQCQIPEYRHEKIMQSLCNHDPPCEVVRTCVKPKYDPTLHNPCIHVPMCEKIAECIMNGRHGRSKCSHRPKCLELPICTRDYIMLTATEEVGVQAKPGGLVCRHEPPCVLIPKCFDRVLYDGCIAYDSIPGCVHRPMCEMIPACCRKSTKETVSVSSQHPNLCRIA